MKKMKSNRLALMKLFLLLLILSSLVVACDALTGKKCDPSYPDVCIPPPPPDLNCPDIQFRNFKVVGNDSHGFNGDHNGKGCE